MELAKHLCSAIFSLFQLPADRLLAEARLLSDGFLAVSIEKVDHYLFPILAAYPSLSFHFFILTLYVLGVIKYLSISLFAGFIIRTTCFIKSSMCMVVNTNRLVFGYGFYKPVIGYAEPSSYAI